MAACGCVFWRVGGIEVTLSAIVNTGCIPQSEHWGEPVCSV